MLKGLEKIREKCPEAEQVEHRFGYSVNYKDQDKPRTAVFFDRETETPTLDEDAAVVKEKLDSIPDGCLPVVVLADHGDYKAGEILALFEPSGDFEEALVVSWGEPTNVCEEIPLANIRLHQLPEWDSEKKSFMICNPNGDLLAQVPSSDGNSNEILTKVCWTLRNLMFKS